MVLAAESVEEKPVVQNSPLAPATIHASFLSTCNRRFQACVFGMTVSLLLALAALSYSIYFYYVFEVYKNTTSYFPWAWQVES